MEKTYLEAFSNGAIDIKHLWQLVVEKFLTTTS